MWLVTIKPAGLPEVLVSVPPSSAKSGSDAIKIAYAYLQHWGRTDRDAPNSGTTTSVVWVPHVVPPEFAADT